MREAQEREAALVAADSALNGRRVRSVSRFASIELRSSAPQEGVWEFASMIAVAVAAFVFVVGLWFY